MYVTTNGCVHGERKSSDESPGVARSRLPYIRYLTALDVPYLSTWYATQTTWHFSLEASLEHGETRGRLTSVAEGHGATAYDVE